MRKRTITQSRRSGFTLIELVMVIMILAIVAGLAVPIVGWLRRSANYASQSHTTGALGANLELYRTTYGNNGYPDHLDSLMLGGTDGVQAAPTGGLYTGAGGVGDYADKGHDADLYSMGNLDADQTASFNWLSHIFDHDTNKHYGLQGNPGNAAIHERTFDGNNVAVVARPDATGATVGFREDGTTALSGEGLLLVNELYPDGIPSDVTLVAFGLGQYNDAVGTTLQSAPLDARVDNSEVYGRYLAVFACYSPRAGRRAQLKAVLNAKARTTNNALSEFWQSTNPE